MVFHNPTGEEKSAACPEDDRSAKNITAVEIKNFIYAESTTLPLYKISD
jgi:hypothetical protein